MFEVGKTYIRKGIPLSVKWQCVYVTDITKIGVLANAIAVLKYQGGAEDAVERRFWDEYEEAPVVNEYLRDVLLEGDSFKVVDAFISENEANHIGQIKITVVDGKLDEVEIIG